MSHAAKEEAKCSTYGHDFHSDRKLPPSRLRRSRRLCLPTRCGTSRRSSGHVACSEGGSKMQHLWSRLSLLLALLVLAIATSSAGTQVTLGQSTIGDVLFINTGPDSASFSFTGMCGAQSNCLSGYGYYGSNVGTYEMWVVGGPMTLVLPPVASIPLT